jgi:uncharacterized protein (DUF433 family)
VGQSFKSAGFAFILKLALKGRIRTMSPVEKRIVIDPKICNGRPVIRGTRITAQSVLEMMGAGDSIEEVLAAYPTLSRPDVLACLLMSSQLLGHNFKLETVS